MGFFREYRDVWVAKYYSGQFVGALWLWVTVCCKAPVFTQKAGGLMIPLAADPQACTVPPPISLPSSLHPSLPSFIPATSAASRQRKKNQSLHHELLRCLPTASEIYRRVVSLSLCVSFPLSLSLFSCKFSLRFVNYAQQNEFNILFLLSTLDALFVQFTLRWIYCVGSCISLWAVQLICALCTRPVHWGCLQKIYLFVHSFLYD